MFDAGQDMCWILLWEIRVVGTLTLLGGGGGGYVMTWQSALAAGCIMGICLVDLCVKQDGWVFAAAILCVYVQVSSGGFDSFTVLLCKKCVCYCHRERCVGEGLGDMALPV